MNMKKRGFQLALSAAVIALAVSGCSAGGGAPAPSASLDAADQEGLATAQQMIDEVSAQPTQISRTIPIDAPIPAGKRLTYITCGTSTCNLMGDVIKSAAEKVGWEFTNINVDGTPEAYKTAMQQVVRDKPDALILNTMPRELVEPELKELADAGVWVSETGVTYKAGDGIQLVVTTPDNYTTLGELQAAWATTQVEGSGQIGYFNVNEFELNVVLEESYTSKLAELCPGCTTDVTEVPLSALGKDVPQRVVSYLRGHPEVKNIVFTFDDMVIGVPEALATAGLSDVNILGYAPNVTTLQYVADGKMAGSIAYPQFDVAYTLLDAAVRQSAGVALDDSTEMPFWLLTEENMPELDGSVFPEIDDIQDQYLKLWGVA